MKIRTGFVSNSSSSSFVIVGKLMSLDDFVEMYHVNFTKLFMNKYSEWEFADYFREFVKKNCVDLKSFTVEPHGSFGDCDEVIIYKIVPTDTKRAMSVIKEVSDKLGVNTIVEVLKKDSESGIYVGS